MMAAEANTLHRARRIGIFGHVGNKNLGDEAIIAAVIQNIKRRRPEAQIYGFTLNPEDTENRHKITAFQIQRHRGLRRNVNELTTSKISQGLTSASERVKSKIKSIRVVYVLLRGMKRSWDIFWGSLAEVRFLVQCYRNLKGIDLLIIAGSQQLIDYIGGPWEHSYTVFKWVLLAKSVKAKVAFVSVGAGPIRSSLGKCFVRNSLLLASYRSYRDETSRRLAETLGISGQNTVFPDLVYSLQIDLPSTNSLSHESPPIVGINPVPFFDEQHWLGANPREYAIYISKLAIFALWLIQRGYRILFFPTQLRLDPPVITDIKNLMHANSNGYLEQKIFEKPIYSFDDLVSAIRMTNIVVATRFHGIIIPFVLNRPVLGIAYQKKTIDLMAQMGQSEYVVDIHSFDADSLKARFMLLESRSEKIKEEIEHHKSAFCHALQSQYDQVLNLV
jgi:polysaccharide pyruvyl transferase WcaK-like protein